MPHPTIQIIKCFQLTKIKLKTYLIFLLSKVNPFIKIQYINFFLTTVIAISTAFVSYMQWDAMKQQLTEMKLARKSDQRPFIVHNFQDEIVQPNKKISFGINSTNYGKSPALSLTALKFSAVLHGSNANESLESWFSKRNKKHSEMCGDSIIPPTGNPFYYNSAKSENFLTAKEHSDFMRGAHPVIVAVVEYYSDMACNTYITETAISFQPNGAMVIIKNITRDF